MNTTYTNIPNIYITFKRDFLYIPWLGWELKELLKLIEFLKKKITSKQFKKFPTSQKKLLLAVKATMEIYELAKKKESEKEEGKFTKTAIFGYRPEIDPKSDRKIYQRLQRRACNSESDSRVRKVY